MEIISIWNNRNWIWNPRWLHDLGFKVWSL